MALLLSAAALSVCVLAVRGCRIAGQPAPAPASQPTLRVYFHETDRVRTMGLEDYLTGVVGGEMPLSFPLEALKAQAVAARTYAARRMPAYGGKPCGRGGGDICTDSACCQSYKDDATLAARWGEAAAAYADKLRTAVYATAGEIALYAGEPIEALYHSTAGDRTEDAQHVFANAVPYLVGVDSPGEQDAAYYTDEKTLTRRAFAEAVNQSWPKAGLKAGEAAAQVEILSRYPSGQVETLRLGSITVTGRALRKCLGLRSANFILRFTDDAVTFITKGYGHGVGMSQYGARAIALEGGDYRTILLHYYTGVELGTLAAARP